MQGQHYIFPVFQMLAHIFNLAGIYVRHGKLHSAGQIDNCFPVSCRLPDIQNRVAYFQRILRLCSRKTLRTVFKTVGSATLFRQILQKLRAVHGNLKDFFFGFFEHLLSLGERGRVIYVNDSIFAALQSLEGFPDNVLPGLGQHLNRHIIRNQIPLNQRPQEFIFCL